MGKQDAPPPAYNSAPWQQGQLAGQPDKQLGPDFYGAAGQQGKDSYNVLQNQTQANRPDQSNAFGAFSNWSQDPKSGQWSQQQGFGGGLGQYAQGLEGQLGQQGALDLSGLPQLQSGDAARNAAEQSIYGRETSRLDPQWAAREQSQKAELANQGLDPTSAAYTKQMDDFGRQRNDAYSNAQRDSIMGGGQEASRTFGMSLAGRQQSLAELLRQRSDPMQGLAGLQGLSGQGQFSQAGQQQVPPWLQAAMATGNYGLGQTNQANQNAADAWTGGMQILSPLIQAGAAACDERIKINIRRHATRQAMPGVPEAEFEYRDHPGRVYRGVIAQDVEKVRPDLVFEVGGVKHISGIFPEAIHG